MFSLIFKSTTEQFSVIEYFISSKVKVNHNDNLRRSYSSKAFKLFELASLYTTPEKNINSKLQAIFALKCMKQQGSRSLPKKFAYRIKPSVVDVPRPNKTQYP